MKMEATARRGHAPLLVDAIEVWNRDVVGPLAGRRPRSCRSDATGAVPPDERQRSGFDSRDCSEAAGASVAFDSRTTV